MSGSQITTLKGFSALEICRILIASKGTNLKEIQCGSLKISFHPEASKVSQVSEENPLAGQPSKPENISGEVIEDHELQELVSEIAQENLMIQDPAAYEQAILDERVYGERDGEVSGRGSRTRRP